MDLLPIGSVVKLYDYEEYIMITGWFQKDENNTNWDYCGCLYPVGMVEPGAFLFNREGIELTLFLGYQDHIQLGYKMEMEEYISKNFSDWDDHKIML